jgi:hypothetical protein
MESFTEERRIQHRVEAAISIQIQGVDSTGHAYNDAATALELSRRGLSFLTRHELALLASLMIVIPGLGPTRSALGPSDFFTEAAVVRTSKEDEEFNRIGVRFIGATLPMYSAEGV